MQWHTAKLLLELSAIRAIFGRIFQPKAAAMQPAVHWSCYLYRQYIQAGPDQELRCLHGLSQAPLGWPYRHSSPMPPMIF